ncbi:hypothetical protein JNB63_18075 [Microbacterium trichothecenolyticum]|uniref:hypothetical protein n=1 Tax=Microbacterium trichothecenolyticum TaxID=69370 RepID=UPI001C6F4AC7|nr:hypothetical protein [Microbacterium trichothecenolyticum]MBW9122011.1 hypothetical protein [Microbacterium trichothecenolyticum]
MSTPTRVRVRTYQVGFGDCFLVSVEYDEPLPDGRAERHLLIDYGTSHAPREGMARGRMGDVAALIEKHTGGELDVLVVTHRHRDHLRGFEVDAGAAIIRRLAPKLVLRSWTEDPRLSATADGPGLDAAEPPNGLSRAAVRYAALLAQAQEHVAKLTQLVGLDDEVKAAAEDQLKNAEAVALLDELSLGDRGRYLHAGMESGIEGLVPGMRATVLGPPTVDQDPRVAKQREDDPEYWLAALGASLRVVGSAADAGADAPAPISHGPGPVRWLIDRLADQRSHSAARLVRDLDDALNNTSVILLLEIEGLSMLFPGDAQIENWRLTLERLKDEPQLRDRLAGIDLYKVGHHGSRNATPRSLHALWKDRKADRPRLAAVMSTRQGVHGTGDGAVPQPQLVTALREVADLYSTDDLTGGEEWIELEADAAGGPFRPVPFVKDG